MKQTYLRHIPERVTVARISWRTRVCGDACAALYIRSAGDTPAERGGVAVRVVEAVCGAVVVKERRLVAHVLDALGREGWWGWLACHLM